MLRRGDTLYINMRLIFIGNGGLRIRRIVGVDNKGLVGSEGWIGISRASSTVSISITVL